MLTVGTAQAQRGSVAHGHIAVGELALGSRLDIPVLLIRGVEDGPTLWLNGAVHGDEINGFMAVRALARDLAPEALRGAIIATPLSNPLAVQWRNKINPYDFLDMDQQFPGTPTGQYSQRAAHALFSEIQDKADYLISFHTVATTFDAQPYTVFKTAPGVAPEVSQKSQELALSFGLRANCRVDLASATGEIPGGVAGALDASCILRSIPAFMAEIGSGGKFEPGRIAIAVQGIWNVLRTLGMVAGSPSTPKKQLLITKRAFLYSNTGGFLLNQSHAGQTLAAGQTIATVVDLFDERECIKAPSEAHVIMTRTNPVVHTGDRVAFLGLEYSEIL